MFMNIQLSAVISWEQSLILGQDKQSLIQTTAGFAGLGNTHTHMYSRGVQLWSERLYPGSCCDVLWQIRLIIANCDD